MARTAVPRKERIIAQSVARETSSPVVTPPLPPGCVKGRASSRQQASPSQWPTSCSTQNLCARTRVERKGAAVYLSRYKDSDSEWSEGNVASTSFLPGCVLVMPDEGDLLEFNRHAQIVAGRFSAPVASIPAAPLSARPVPPLVTKLDSETVMNLRCSTNHH